MVVAGSILHREKVVARKLALICVALSVGFAALSIAYLAGWGAETNLVFKVISYSMVPLGLYQGLFATVLRTAVTTDEIHLAVGFRARRIPLRSIATCALFERGKVDGGVELFTLGTTRGVMIEWTDETSKARKTLIGSENPEGLLASIERARARTAIATRVSPIATSAMNPPPALEEPESDRDVERRKSP